MQQIIETIYKTRSVVGRSGRVYELTKVSGQISPEEGQFLYSLIHDDPTIRKTLEVGCAYGLSTLFICSAIQGRAGAWHTIIDPYESSYWDGVGIRNLETAGIDWFTMIELGSEYALPKLLEGHEGQFDFVFVDGMHTFDHTLLDCFYATRLLRRGGVLALDDACWPSVCRVVDFLKNCPCYEQMGSVTSKKRKAWKRILARGLASPIPRTVWAKVLAAHLVHSVFDDRVVSMVALRKAQEDTRSFDWHVDTF